MAGEMNEMRKLVKIAVAILLAGAIGGGGGSWAMRRGETSALERAIETNTMAIEKLRDLRAKDSEILSELKGQMGLVLRLLEKKQ